MASNSHQAIWEMYTQSWSSDLDKSKRQHLFDQCLNPECVYTDPTVQKTGYEQLAGVMAELHKQVPGVRFTLTKFRSHHNRSLAHWDMFDGEGKLLSQGESYGFYGDDGRLLQMTGFFDVPDGPK